LPSDKQFILPSGKIIEATELAEYPFNIRLPARKLHITPGISQHSLLSTGKFAEANYITIFDNKIVNIYNANDTTISVSRGAILWGWRDKNINLWRIPLEETRLAMISVPGTVFLAIKIKIKSCIF
jgi:hypothetical protein